MKRSYVIYLLWPHPDDSDQRGYVGCTCDLNNRVKVHQVSEHWPSGFDLILLGKLGIFHQARKVEQFYIRNYNGLMADTLRNKASGWAGTVSCQTMYPPELVYQASAALQAKESGQ